MLPAITHAKPLPLQFPLQPAPLPTEFIDIHIQAAKRYLFETELKEALTQSEMSANRRNVAGYSLFIQGIRDTVGVDKLKGYGRECFTKTTPFINRPSSQFLRAAVSNDDKIFVKIRDGMLGISKLIGVELIAKWHGGAQVDVFCDAGINCYGYTATMPICDVMTGFLEEAVHYYTGLNMHFQEVECMSQGAASCRWHGQPA